MMGGVSVGLGGMLAAVFAVPATLPPAEAVMLAATGVSSASVDSNGGDVSSGAEPIGQASGSIAGTVRFNGSPPAAAVLQMAADPYCLTAHQGETVAGENLVVADGGGLRWAFVHVRGVSPRGSSPAPPVELNQQACVYQPRVLGMQAGGTIRITNSDTTLHNVNVQAASNPRFNVAQPIPGMTTERTFANPELMVPVKCDVHGWMQAWIGVLPHPWFAVTGADGSFEIDGVPVGEHVLEVWHETLGTQTLNVTVTAGATAAADFAFAGDR